MSRVAATSNRQLFLVSRAEERRVIVASSVGTVFEWYDFFLYAVLAPFFAKLFFPPENETAALLGAFAAYAAGFIVRPFGAVVLGRLGDLLGRKYTFLISIVFMGFSTFTVGLLPTFSQVGWLAPALLIIMRLLQGLAVGGEYGGAATYVAEYTEAHKRGLATSWIQTTATFGLILALIVLGVCRWYIPASAFEIWGWRIPFLISILLLVVSVYIRVSLRETPVFLRMKAEGRRSQYPLWESFFVRPNVGYVVSALFGVTAGQGAVWYTAHFYTMFFLTIPLRLDYVTTYMLMGAVLLAAVPFFLLFGWLSDRVGRLKIILIGFSLAAATYIPLFQLLTNAVNPALADFQKENPILIRVDRSTCNFHIFVGPWSKFSTCDQVTDYLTKSGLSFKVSNEPGLDGVVLTIGSQTVEVNTIKASETAHVLQRALFAANYPGLGWKYANGVRQTDARGAPIFEFRDADRSRVNFPVAFAVLFTLMLYAAMAYGPIAAYLVELFPAKIRYTSMSFPYHIGNGVFGGILPLLATAIVASTGNVYAGLWYPIGVALMSTVVGAVFLRDHRNSSIYA